MKKRKEEKGREMREKGGKMKKNEWMGKREKKERNSNRNFNQHSHISLTVFSCLYDDH